MPASIQTKGDNPERKEFEGYSAQIDGDQIHFTVSVELRSGRPLTDPQLAAIGKALNDLAGGGLTQQELLTVIHPEFVRYSSV